MCCRLLRIQAPSDWGTSAYRRCPPSWWSSMTRELSAVTSSEAATCRRLRRPRRENDDHRTTAASIPACVSPSPVGRSCQWLSAAAAANLAGGCQQQQRPRQPETGRHLPLHHSWVTRQCIMSVVASATRRPCNIVSFCDVIVNVSREFIYSAESWSISHCA